MPVHRIRHTSSDPVPDLAAAVQAVESAGESIVQVVPWANGWLLVTSASELAAARKPASQANLERRARKAS